MTARIVAEQSFNIVKMLLVFSFILDSKWARGI